MGPDDVVEVRDGGGMTTAQREQWRADQAKRHAALPQPTRPRRAEDRPKPVADPAQHGQALAARCLRNAQGRRS